ncbi:MAG: hypothetical protein HYV08_01535 [Deltaproteobacteria bacterium]|nr:hypothetical protein [Deltaproteobacteria bacterium]
MRSPRRPARPTIYSPAFVLAFLANFCFFSNSSAFFLLPLYIKSRQGTEAAIGAIMGMYSGASII